MRERVDGGASRVTIIDIARASGVSKSTVSLVIQGSSLVHPETRQRVQNAIEDLGYVYNRGAANLRRARSNIVGMVINDLTNPFYTELAVGIERVFQSAGYVPLIANTAENAIRQTDVLKSFREQGLAGLIISAARGTEEKTIREFVDVGIPVIHVMRRVPGSRAATVIPDNRRGARVAVDHLLELGHRRIAFVGGFSDMVVQQERCGGYRDALAAAGFGVDPSLIVDVLPNRDGGDSAIGQLLGMREPPTAVMCFNDVVGFGVCLGLKKRGLEPGRDVAVVGFDDVTEARHVVPALTTVAVDCFGLGERAAQLMLRMIERGTPSAENEIGSVQLIVRESCGAKLRENGVAAR
jgi:LacI family transcriptional regulator